MKKCHICCGCSDEIQISPNQDANQLELEFQAKPIKQETVPLKKIVVHQMGIPEPAWRKNKLSANVALEKAASKNQIISNICQVWSDLVRNFSNRFDQIQVLPDFGWN